VPGAPGSSKTGKTPVTTEVGTCTSATGYLAARTVPATGSADDCVKTGDYLSRRVAPTPPDPLATVSSLTFEYAYDESGNVTSATRTLAPAPEPAIAPTDARTYTYDSLNRLTGSTRSDGSAATYAYDPAGNRTSSTTTAATATLATAAQFNAANQLMATTTADASSSYRYDANGNRTSQTESSVTTDFGYRSDGRLTSVSREGRSSTYAYDGLGRQITASETSAHGTTSSTTAWNGSTPIEVSTPSSTTAFVTDALGDVALEASAALGTDGSGEPPADAAWSLIDRLGSTVAQAAGSSIAQLSNYDDWGAQSFDTTSWSATAGFTGEHTDPGYNLTTYLARTYDPTTGTWLTQDSWRGLLTQPQTAARYAYVTNSPTTLIDPDGQRPWDPAAVASSKSSAGWNYTPTSQGHSASPTASDYYASRAQGLSSDRLYTSNGTGDEADARSSAKRCASNRPCDRNESMAVRHALNARSLTPSAAPPTMTDTATSFLLWSLTRTALPNPRMVSGLINIVWGSWKFGTGVALLTLGTAADVTGIGAIIGVPVDLWGAYQAFTGGAKAIKGVNQYIEGVIQGGYDQTPFDFAVNVGFGLLPAGSTLADFLGGAP
jgi:RHS repeat-associated protein